MMLALVLAMSFLSPVGACADLSGRYVHQGEDNRVYVSIVQTGCERIAITWDTSLPPARVPFPLVLDESRRHSARDHSRMALLDSVLLGKRDDHSHDRCPGAAASPAIIRLRRVVVRLSGLRRKPWRTNRRGSLHGRGERLHISDAESARPPDARDSRRTIARICGGGGTGHASECCRARAVQPDRFCAAHGRAFVSVASG